MSEESLQTPKREIIRSWWQGGERYAENISETGETLELPFRQNALYAKALWEQLSPKMLLRPLDWNAVFGNSLEINLEIGIGNGEFIAYSAENYQQENWVGVEVFKKVFDKAASKAAKNKTGNIRVIQFDADLIIRLFPDGYLKNIHVNFPDPWPKNQHKRRRLLKTPFLNLCATKLKTGGILHIATDHDDYAIEIQKNISKVSTLKSAFPEAFLRNIDDCFPTKYYKKFAVENGAYFFRYFKL